MRFTVVKRTGVHRAIIEQENGTKECVALFGTVRDLAAQNIIFLDGKPAGEKWIVLFAKQEQSSPEMDSKDACKQYIESCCKG